MAGCGGARPADSDKDERAVTRQKASLIFVGANGGLINQNFEPLLGDNRIALIKLLATNHSYSLLNRWEKNKRKNTFTIHRWAIYAYSLSIDTLFYF